MKVLHLMVSGNAGGIEVLMKNYAMRSKHENVFLFAREAGDVAREIEENGSRIIVLNLKRDGSLKTIGKIIELCGTEQVDAVISHNAVALFKLAVICINVRYPRIKTCVMAHSNAYDICRGDRKGLFIRKSINKIAFNTCDNVVAISESVKKSLIQYLGVREDKIRVIYNGINIDEFRTLKEKRAGDAVSLIYVGRLTKKKGVHNILNAMACMDDRLRICLKIVGDGAYREELEALAANLNLAERVEFCGRRRDIPELFQDADIFVHMPEWEEGFGVAVVEAMAAGKICIVSNSGALPEIITDGVDGFLIEKGNVGALARKIEDVSKELNGVEMQLMRKNAKKRAEGFPIEKYVRSLDELLD